MKRPQKKLRPRGHAFAEVAPGACFALILQDQIPFGKRNYTMSKSKLPQLSPARQERMKQTLTQARLGKYLKASGQDIQRAMRLYVLNTKLSAAIFADLHYTEVVLRNKLDEQLRAGFGHEWYTNPVFLAVVGMRCEGILKKAQKDAAKHWIKGATLPPGKVIAELTFGFWHTLTDRKYEHRLWVPYLHKAFLPGKPPARAAFNMQLEKLRQLRNRIAHHEPIFHMALRDELQRIDEVTHRLCHTTAAVMKHTSTSKRLVMRLP